MLPNGIVHMGTGNGTDFKMYTFTGSNTLTCTSLTCCPYLNQYNQVCVSWSIESVTRDTSVSLLDVLTHDIWFVGECCAHYDIRMVDIALSWYEEFCTKRAGEVDLVQLWDLPKELAGIVMGYLGC
jgi:hypothetical protein